MSSMTGSAGSPKVSYSMSMPLARAVAMTGCCLVLTTRSSRRRRPPQAGQVPSREAGVGYVRWRGVRSSHHMSPCRVRAPAPGRVNLIGDHTDYTGGLALPIAIDLGVDVVFERDESVGRVELTSFDRPGRATVDRAQPLASVGDDAPRWARYVA